MIFFSIISHLLELISDLRREKEYENSLPQEVIRPTLVYTGFPVDQGTAEPRPGLPEEAKLTHI